MLSMSTPFHKGKDQWDRTAQDAHSQSMPIAQFTADTKVLRESRKSQLEPEEIVLGEAFKRAT